MVPIAPATGGTCARVAAAGVAREPARGFVAIGDAACVCCCGLEPCPGIRIVMRKPLPGTCDDTAPSSAATGPGINADSVIAVKAARTIARRLVGVTRRGYPQNHDIVGM